MERADFDSREGRTDTFATDEEGSPPATIHTLKRDNGVDNEMSTLASQATIETLLGKKVNTGSACLKARECNTNT